jgi:hypothetical protein
MPPMALTILSTGGSVSLSRRESQELTNPGTFGLSKAQGRTWNLACVTHSNNQLPTSNRNTQRLPSAPGSRSTAAYSGGGPRNTVDMVEGLRAPSLGALGHL